MFKEFKLFITYATPGKTRVILTNDLGIYILSTIIS